MSNNGRPSSSSASSSFAEATFASASSAAPPLSIKLSSLPLRPSTLASFVRRGFGTTDDVRESKDGGGGVSNLAAELGTTLPRAAAMAREVEEAVRGLTGGGGVGGAAACDEDNGGDGDRYGDGSEGGGGQGGSSPGGGMPKRQRQQHRHRPNHANPNPPSCVGLTAAQILARTDASSSGQGAASGTGFSRGGGARHIVTFCRAIDSLLGGGVARAELTEVAGMPGAGKTQLAMQLCVDARLPRRFGGAEGEAVYIDSEGSFSPERCLTMAEALVKHVRSSADRRHRTARTEGKPLPPPVPEWFDPENILDGIHVYRVHDEAAQTAVIHSLPAFLKEREEAGTPVRVVVIDSIAFHYRCAALHSDFKSRTRQLAWVAAYLSDLSANYDLAVVAVNQMTTKVGAGVGFSGGADPSEKLDSRLVPALGESWAHSTTTRLLLTVDGGFQAIAMGNTSTGRGSFDGGNATQVRRCRLVKSPHKAAGTAAFQVLEQGIRDAPPPPDVVAAHRKRPRQF